VAYPRLHVTATSGDVSWRTAWERVVDDRHRELGIDDAALPARFNRSLEPASSSGDSTSAASAIDSTT
jgi:hypothetical protein